MTAHDNKVLLTVNIKSHTLENNDGLVKTNFKIDDTGIVSVEKVVLEEKIKKLVEKEKKDEK